MDMKRKNYMWLFMSMYIKIMQMGWINEVARFQLHKIFFQPFAISNNT